VKPIHPETAEAIKRLLDHYHKRQANSHVFRWASNTGTIWPRLGAIMDRAGLPDAREFKFHCIRKSSVSHFAAAGGDGASHAGHSSDAITRKHYYDPMIVNGANPTSILFRPGEVTG
jgi:integrase